MRRRPVRAGVMLVVLAVVSVGLVFASIFYAQQAAADERRRLEADARRKTFEATQIALNNCQTLRLLVRRQNIIYATVFLSKVHGSDERLIPPELRGRMPLPPC